MIFTGSYRRTLDEKLRLSIPKHLRTSLGESNLFMAPGTERALVIYTEELFEELGRALNRLSPAAHEARSFSRLFYSQAQPVEVDRQGRLRIPPELAKLSGFEADVMLLGVRDRIEVWDCANWERFMGETQPSYDQLAERVLGDAHQLNAN